jgi:hypothetical protein
MENIELKLLRGLPIEVSDIGHIHPLTLDQFAKVGEVKYMQFISCILFDKESMQIDGVDLNKLETITLLSMHDEMFRNVFCEALSLFLKDNVYLDIPNLVFRVRSTNKEITLELYQQIVEIVKEQNFIKNKVNQEEQYIPHDDKAKELIEKLKEIKSRIKEQNFEESIGLTDIISIVASYSRDLNILNIWGLTIYQLYVEYIRLMMRDNYESQFAMMLQGADVKSSEMKHWASKLNK